MDLKIVIRNKENKVTVFTKEMKSWHHMCGKAACDSIHSRVKPLCAGRAWSLI